MLVVDAGFEPALRSKQEATWPSRNALGQSVPQTGQVLYLLALVLWLPCSSDQQLHFGSWMLGGLAAGVLLTDGRLTCVHLWTHQKMDAAGCD